jgi:phenylalanyl-tRNA synthetase beta chain
MHTDASHRFERGVDPNGVRAVLQLAASLIAELGAGVVTPEAVDAYPNPVPAKRVTLRFARLRSLLGTDATKSDAARLLTALGVSIVSSSDEALVCELPTFRPDLLREVDLIEEVARLYGYERLPTTLPRVRPSVTGTPRRIQFARAMKGAAVATGLHEAMCFGFVSPDDLARHRVPTDAVRVANPMTVDRSVMRTSLLPGLATAASRALRHGARLVRLFELGSSFHAVAGDVLPEERAALAFVLLGEREAWFGSPRAVDFYDAKGHIEAIVHTLTGHRVSFELSESLDASAPYLHPKRRAVVLLGDRRIGCLGEIHPDVVDATDLGGRGLYAELDVTAVLEAADALGIRAASGLPRYPAVTRDLAVLVDEAHPVGSLMGAMRASGAPLLESIELFDEYRGEHFN